MVPTRPLNSTTFLRSSSNPLSRRESSIGPLIVFIGDGLAITLGNKLSEVAPAAIPFRLVYRNFFRLILGLWVECGFKHALKIQESKEARYRLFLKLVANTAFMHIAAITEYMVAHKSTI